MSASQLARSRLERSQSRSPVKRGSQGPAGAPAADETLCEGGHYLHTYQSDTTIQPWYPSTPFTSTSTTRADYPVHPLATQFTRLQQTGGGGPPQVIDHRRTESQSTAHASYKQWELPQVDRDGSAEPRAAPPPFTGTSTAKDSYVPWPVKEAPGAAGFRRPPDPDVRVFMGETENAAQYRAWEPEPIRPEEKQYRETTAVPFKGTSETRDKYQPWPAEEHGSIAPPEPLLSVPFTSNSTSRADYPVHPLATQFTRLQQTGGGGPPQVIDHRRTESQSTAHASYKQWELPQVDRDGSAEPRAAPPPFTGTSTAKDSYVPWPVKEAPGAAGFRRPPDPDVRVFMGETENAAQYRAWEPEPIRPEEEDTYKPSKAVFQGMSEHRASFDSSRQIDMGRLASAVGIDIGLQVQGGRFYAVLPKGTRAPAREQVVFTTVVENQNVVDIRVCGQREDTGELLLLDEFELTMMVPARPGGPRVVITFELAADWALTVSAHSPSDGTNGSSSVIMRDAARAGLLDLR